MRAELVSTPKASTICLGRAGKPSILQFCSQKPGASSPIPDDPSRVGSGRGDRRGRRRAADAAGIRPFVTNAWEQDSVTAVSAVCIKIYPRQQPLEEGKSTSHDQSTGLWWSPYVSLAPRVPDFRSPARTTPGDLLSGKALEIHIWRSHLVPTDRYRGVGWCWCQVEASVKVVPKDLTGDLQYGAVLEDGIELSTCLIVQ